VFKVSNICEAIFVCFVFFYVSNTYSKEYSIEADVDARTEYNSNIFLTSLPHDSTKGVIITPSLSGLIKEKRWEGKLRARIKSHNYSDANLDSNDQYFDFTGKYFAERNVFSLNVNYDLASSLNSASDSFGIVARRINTKRLSISPKYTRLLTERLILSVSYTYSDVDFLEAKNTGFTPYITETGSGALVYDLTKKDKLTISLVAVDYASRDERVKYRLFMSRFGIDHKFSETLSTDFLAGVSRRNSTNLQTQSFDFFGQPITITREIDAKNRGLVLDAGITQLFENGQVEGRISRDNTTDSFGGLNEVNRFKINYTDKISALWRYNISGRYEDVSSISSGSRRTDRKLFFLESSAYYSISRNWNAKISYRYVVRRFKSDTSNNVAANSNRIYVGLTYNFPSLSTF